MFEEKEGEFRLISFKRRRRPLSCLLRRLLLLLLCRYGFDSRARTLPASTCADENICRLRQLQQRCRPWSRYAIIAIPALSYRILLIDPWTDCASLYDRQHTILHDNSRWFHCDFYAIVDHNNRPFDGRFGTLASQEMQAKQIYFILT
jgi:hypothetical protein